MTEIDELEDKALNCAICKVLGYQCYRDDDSETPIYWIISADHVKGWEEWTKRKEWDYTCLGPNQWDEVNAASVVLDLPQWSNDIAQAAQLCVDIEWEISQEIGRAHV